MSKKFAIALIILLLIVIGAAYALLAPPALMQTAEPQKYAVVSADGQPLADYVIPDDTAIASAPNAIQVRLGQRLLNDTARLLPGHVGAAMNCNSCHVQQGKKPLGAPYINTYNSFPQFNPRAGREVTLEERINGCLQRSMNGTPLAADSEAMQAMIAYMRWLAQDVPHGAKVQIKNAWPIDTTLTPDPVRGQAIYAAQCAACHGFNGEGKRNLEGDIVFPPLWGDASFNIGAGMARTYKAASFVRNNMPMGARQHGGWGEGAEGTLSDQEAVDVAEYFTHMPRPDFAGKASDWPSGKKPKDARY